MKYQLVRVGTWCILSLVLQQRWQFQLGRAFQAVLNILLFNTCFRWTHLGVRRLPYLQELQEVQGVRQGSCWVELENILLIFKKERALTPTVALRLALPVVVGGTRNSKQVVSRRHHSSPGGIGHVSELGQISHSIIIEIVDVVDDDSHEYKSGEYRSSGESSCCCCHTSRHLECRAFFPPSIGLYSAWGDGHFTQVTRENGRSFHVKEVRPVDFGRDNIIYSEERDTYE